MEAGLSNSTWQSCIKHIHSSYVCTRHSLIQFKVFHHLHLSRTKMVKINPSLDPSCIRCHQTPASLYHTFWSCKSLCIFRNILNTFSIICEKLIPPNPYNCSIGISPRNYYSHKKTIWCESVPPSQCHWVTFLKLEKLRYTAQGFSNKFSVTWQAFIQYVNNTLMCRYISILQFLVYVVRV